MFKKERGITLVALVVTIVVLLILAGISLSLVLGQNGIVTRAQDGGKNYMVASNEEENTMENVETWLNETIENLQK